LLHILKVDLKRKLGIVAQKRHVEFGQYFLGIRHDLQNFYSGRIVNVEEADLVHVWDWLNKVENDHATVHIVVGTLGVWLLNNQNVTKWVAVFTRHVRGSTRTCARPRRTASLIWSTKIGIAASLFASRVGGIKQARKVSESSRRR
jgi:hypothetical protein